MRGPSVRGARRLTTRPSNEQAYFGPCGEHGKQAQRSNRGPIACFGPSADEKRGLASRACRCPTPRRGLQGGEVISESAL